MNYLFLFFDNNHESIAEICLRSLARHNTECTVLLNGLGVNEEKMMAAYPHGIKFYDLKESDFKNRIATHKIEQLIKMPLETGDNVLVIDPDIILQCDPFKAFSNDGDMFVTTRHYPCVWSVNGGVFGFKMTAGGKCALEYYEDQVHSKSWEPYREFMIKWRHLHLTNWSVGQDFLCIAYSFGLPFSCKIYDLGPRWNYCPETFSVNQRSLVLQGKDDLIGKIGNSEYKILHFKSHMKKFMPEAEKLILENYTHYQ